MVTNRRLVTLDQDDLYPTPAWATKALLDNETFEGSIWEPACGDGAMTKVIEDHYPDHKLCSTDLYDHGFEGVTFYQSNVNFLNVKIDGETFDNIITNPPYNLADDFVQKALQAANKKVAFLMRLAYLEGQSRYESIYAPTPPSRVHVFSERITFYKKGATKKGNGTTAYAWFVWDKEDDSKKTELLWLPPIYKPNSRRASRKADTPEIQTQ